MGDRKIIREAAHTEWIKVFRILVALSIGSSPKLLNITELGFMVSEETPEPQPFVIRCLRFGPSRVEIDAEVRKMKLPPFDIQRPEKSKDEDSASVQRSVIKNFVIMNLGVFLAHVAYYTFLYLQPSLLHEEGLGSLSLAVDYAGQVFACLFIPTLMIKKFTCKWTLVISLAAFIPYFAVTCIPSFHALLVTSAILGAGMGIMWAAVGTFVCNFAYRYAAVTQEDPAIVIGRFFGIFFTSLKASIPIGGLIGYLLLSADKESKNLMSPEVCGSNYCNVPSNHTVSFATTQNPITYQTSFFTNLTESNFTTLTTPMNTTDVFNSTAAPELLASSGIGLYLMSGIFSGICFLGVIVIAVFEDHITTARENNCKLLFATFRLLSDKSQLFLVIVGIVLGVLRSFNAAEYNNAFINCILGLNFTPVATIFFGLGICCGSFMWGFLNKIVGRPFVMVLGTCIYIAYLVTLLFWKPSADQIIVLMVLAGLSGMAEASYLTQITAFYGILFPNRAEAAFTNYRLWECVGLVMGFSWSPFLCFSMKVYITLGLVVLGILTYLYTEFRIWNSKNSMIALK